MKLPDLITDPDTLAGLSHDEAEWAPRSPRSARSPLRTLSRP